MTCCKKLARGLTKLLLKSSLRLTDGDVLDITYEREYSELPGLTTALVAGSDNATKISLCKFL
jgi:hypothetical protein